MKKGAVTVNRDAEKKTRYLNVPIENYMDIAKS